MAQSGDRREVIIVGSNAVTLALLEAPFERHGVLVREIATPSEARSQILGRSVELVLIDLERWRTEGLRLLEFIRRHPRSRGLPVIALTGSENPYYDVTVSLRAGADMYATRPLQVPVLLGCVHALMRRARTAETVAKVDQPRSRLGADDLDPPATSEDDASWITTTHRRAAADGAGSSRPGVLPGAGPLHTNDFRSVPPSAVLKRPASESQPPVAPLQTGGRVIDGPSETAEFHTPEWSLFRVLYTSLNVCLQKPEPMAVLMMEVSTTPDLDAGAVTVFLKRFSRRVVGALGLARQLSPIAGHTTCAVLPDTDEASAMAAVGRLIEVVEGRPFPVGEQVVRARVAVGVAIVPPSVSESAFRIFDDAYKALRRAKRTTGQRWSLQLVAERPRRDAE